MARLRIRIELSRGGVGVPLQKLASVIGEAEKFLRLLGEDVRIDESRGEWLGFDFDPESLHFTAEFVGPVTSQQVEAFNAAFDGTTSLRRSTIAQFARIADAIGEDEIIGFGLYPSGDRAEPAEWRCLSRRDALRIADEIQMLLGASEELTHRSHLPAIQDPALGARMFGGRREHSLEVRKWAEQVRNVESNLTRRIARVESQVEQHSSLLEDLRARAATTEESFRSLLGSVESFCEQAARKIESATAPQALPAPAPQASPAAGPAAPQTPHRKPARFLPWRQTAVSAGAVLALVLTGIWLWPSSTAPIAAKEPAAAKPSEKPAYAAEPKQPPAPIPVAKQPPANPPGAARHPTHVVLEATEPTWVAFVDDTGARLMVQVLMPGTIRSFDLSRGAILRTGNAAGLSLSVDGKPVGSLGGRGQVRSVFFHDGTYRIGAPSTPAAAPAPSGVN